MKALQLFIRFRTLVGCCALTTMMLTAQVAWGDVVGYWPFDGTAEAVVGEEGIEMFDPLPVADRNGTAGGALEFDGVEQYVEVPDGGGLNGVLGGTISLWVKWNGPQDDGFGGSYGAILARQSNGQFSDNVLALNDFDPEFASVIWRQSIAGTTDIASLDAPGDEQWRHIAVAFGPVGSELFMDGESQGTGGGGVPLHDDLSIPLSIGAWSGDGDAYAAAAIDDVAVFDDLLTAEQILALANQTETPLTVGPGRPAEAPLPPGAIPASIHSVSSNLGDNSGFNRTAAHIITGAGLVGDTHSINPEGTMWLNNGTFVEPNDLEPEITFDLGQVSTLESVKVWNYNENLPDRPELLERGVESADILVAGEDLEFTTLISGQDFELAPGDDLTEFGQVIDLSGVAARYVKFEILGNHGGDADFVGLSEVIFFGTSSSLPGDFNGNGVLDLEDVNLLSAQSASGVYDAEYDLNSDSFVNGDDVTVWAKDLKKTWIGDSNLDLEFNSSDLVQVFVKGRYELDEPATWDEGDWNGDLRFNSSDLVKAFVDGGYEKGQLPQARAVPEPFSIVLLALGLLCGAGAARRRWNS